jgi:hypothetical protein
MINELKEGAVYLEEGTAVPDRRSSTERRSHPRYLFTAAAEVAVPQSGAWNVARTNDLSAGGCYVDMVSPFPLGTVVGLRLRKEKKSFEAQAKVVSSQFGMGMGLMFTQIDPVQQSILERWLAEASGELPAACEAPEEEEQAPAEESSKGNHHYVLNELIIALMRKGVLTEPEGKGMLRNLLL